MAIFDEFADEREWGGGNVKRHTTQGRNSRFGAVFKGSLFGVNQAESHQDAKSPRQPRAQQPLRDAASLAVA